MAGYEERPGSGTLFRNDKQDNPKAPDYRGTLCLSTGEVVKLAGWVKEGKKGKFLSLSIDKPREQLADNSFRGGSTSPVAGGRGQDQTVPFDDECPFVSSNSIR